MTAAPHSFQTTRWTHVVRLQAGADDTERDRILTQLCRAYWFPLYSYARRSGRSPHDAEDLTQGFFQHALGSDLFAKARQDRGRMRTFLLTAFQHWLHNQHLRETAAKRGGKQPALSFDAMEAEERYRLEPQDLATPEDLYNRRWARDFFIAVKDRLRMEMEAEGKTRIFATLQPFIFVDGREADQGALAESLCVTSGNLRVMLTRFRMRYRDLFREAVADTLDSPTPEQIEQEIRELIRLGAR
jgi:DNA-directed RNA polymerase specialized sigma24 family protein